MEGQEDPISYELVLEASKYVETLLTSKNEVFHPKIAVICGTSLGLLSQAVVPVMEPIPYSDIPNFPQATLAGHDGHLLLGKIGEVSVAMFRGRVHMYQGFSLAQTAFPVRLSKLLGVEKLVVTNVSGAINQTYKVGDIVILKDHINFPGLAGSNPLRGQNDNRFGPRYFSIVDAYSSRWRQRVENQANVVNVSLQQGVYAVVGGPNFESPAEVNMLRILGADVVGMSTVAEVLTAVHCDMEVLALSLVSNLCWGEEEVLTEGFVQPVVDSKKVDLLQLLMLVVEDTTEKWE